MSRIVARNSEFVPNVQAPDPRYREPDRQPQRHHADVPSPGFEELTHGQGPGAILSVNPREFEIEDPRIIAIPKTQGSSAPPTNTERFEYPCTFALDCLLDQANGHTILMCGPFPNQLVGANVITDKPLK